ncbi:Uncharacterised protein [Mycobacterium tuberculosis]|nr:Uncharacterised protein [Mycobacterium tuberculosis]COZ11805.1 Uncharacterised protein [Mycobacterium tuberculosis]COZ31285.1 Uncharacterised protein [Mycobacterium tuberculosis]
MHAHGIVGTAQDVRDDAAQCPLKHRSRRRIGCRSVARPLDLGGKQGANLRAVDLAAVGKGDAV